MHTTFRSVSYTRLLSTAIGAALVGPLAGCERAPTPHAGTPPAAVAAAPPSWCASLPRAANAALEQIDLGDVAGGDWFTVYRVEPGVYAIIEPKQFQEAISYLIVGGTKALLFDTGIGLVPMRPVVERLTTLPVTVLNSHTHFDHVGANHEFSEVMAMDTPFTHASERGLPHESIADEVAKGSFCGAPPVGVDTAAFTSRPWTATRRVTGGDTIALGGRTLEILAAPGHTPDAIALLDRAHGLLWTGDSYYESALWLFSPGTDVEAYERTMTRLAALAPALRRLLPAHNTATADPSRLGKVASAVRTMREGGGVRTPMGGAQVEVRVGDVTFMVAR